jgi:hypothetical protein
MCSSSYAAEDTSLRVGIATEHLTLMHEGVIVVVKGEAGAAERKGVQRSIFFIVKLERC